ncbi:divalent metal cation transporter [Dyella jejuensis]|uniref:Divalent metal cation transporter n=1 Tax=Dyella jejuensis TaxID=1432009 RepID=A0ABW8JK41_9GAMM
MTSRHATGLLKRLRQQLSAGLVTGAADDDPSGIATYSQVGAQFGYATVWSLALALPLMVAIQGISAFIARVTGRGLGSVMREHYPHAIVLPLIGMVAIANIINLGADIAAMGDALRLVVGGPAPVYAALFGLGSLVLQMVVPFSRYAPFLKIMTLSLFAYVITVFVVQVPWLQVFRSVVLPAIHWNAAYTVAIVAILGTTISPYLFFWQAAQEVEEIRSIEARKALKRAPHQRTQAIERIGVDTTVGMIFSNIVAAFIIITTAAVLHAHGKTHIASSAQAAEALRPLAGPFAFALFAFGIIGTGLLALPVLAGSTAYAVCGALGKTYGLGHEPRYAKFFYGVLILATIAAVLINLLPVDPMKALFWSAVINGVIAAPVMAMIMLMGTNEHIMGPACMLGGWMKTFGWLATVVMAAAAVAMFVTWGH